MEGLNLFPLDGEAFRDWLCSAPCPDETAGIAANDGKCPLSCFLQEIYGGSWLVHFENYERLADDLLSPIDACFPLPGWAQQFTRRLDHAMGCQAPVSFAWALAFFDQVSLVQRTSEEG